jgi:MoxR-like ATPase
MSMTTRSIIGRGLEQRLAAACIKANKNVLLEGPVGVGKSVLALHVVHSLGRPVFRVDGDERYTEQKMAGWFDPPLVLKKGYCTEDFIPGPLHQAMTAGGVLFINEINRLPESVQNLLLPALDERLLTVPMLGEFHAAEGFLVIGTMNPREFVATSELSEALRDRFEVVKLDYQTFDEECEIVTVNVAGLTPGLALIENAVALVRATRESPYVRRGASIRAAISMVELAMALGGDDAFDLAAMVTLPNRIELKDEGTGNGEAFVQDLLESLKKN